MQSSNSFELLANSSKKLKVQKLKLYFKEFAIKFNQIRKFGHIYQIHFKRITSFLYNALLTFIVICVYASARHNIWHQELLMRWQKSRLF